MLHESAKSANVVGSLQKYIQDELAGSLLDSSGIDYGGGIPFQDTNRAEWIQVRVPGVARPDALIGPYVHRAGENEPDARGRIVYWMLNINCFVRPAKQASRNNLRLWTLRDVVTGVFREGAVIPVKDHAGEGETIGYLFLDDIADDRPILDPEQKDIEQHRLLFSFQWGESWVP